MTAIPLGGGREFDRIREIALVLGDAAGPLGDDTAPIPRGEGALVVSTDASVEGIHFRRAWLTPREIGWRATAGALSDLAAAGAVPAGITIAVGVPPDVEGNALLDLMRGAGGCCSSVGARVLGGDLTASPIWQVTVTVFGHAVHPVSRRGARPEDGLWVTGTLGGARAALTEWLAGREPGAAERVAFARPQPRLAAGGRLAALGATAMMDLSDGLAGDAPHLAAASDVALEIALETLPLHAAAAAAAHHIEEGAHRFAAAGGEDYELLVAMPSSWNDAERFTEETGVRLTRIGRVVAGQGVTMRLDGDIVQLEGFRHAV